MSGPQDPFRIHCVQSKYIPCEGSLPFVCTEFPITGTGASGDCIRIASSPINCAQLSWNGPNATIPNSWIITRPPAWTEVTVGPTQGQYPTLAAAFTDGCPFVRVLETYIDMSVWSLPGLGITHALIYVDPGIQLTLDPAGPLNITNSNLILRGSGFSSTIIQSPGAGSPFINDDTTILTILNITIRVASPFITGIVLRFFATDSFFALPNTAAGVIDLSTNTNLVTFDQCTFFGGGNMSVILRGSTNAQVIMSDSTLEDTFSTGTIAGTDIALELPGTGTQINGLVYNLAAGLITFSLGGTISDVNDAGANLGTVSLDLPTNDAKLTNINVETSSVTGDRVHLANCRVVGAFTVAVGGNDAMVDNVTVGGDFGVDGGRIICNNVRVTGDLNFTSSFPGGEFQQMVVGGDVNATATIMRDVRFANCRIAGAFNGPTGAFTHTDNFIIGCDITAALSLDGSYSRLHIANTNAASISMDRSVGTGSISGIHFTGVNTSGAWSFQPTTTGVVSQIHITNCRGGSLSAGSAVGSSITLEDWLISNSEFSNFFISPSTNDDRWDYRISNCKFNIIADTAGAGSGGVEGVISGCQLGSYTKSGASPILKQDLNNCQFGAPSPDFINITGAMDVNELKIIGCSQPSLVPGDFNIAPTGATLARLTINACIIGNGSILTPAAWGTRIITNNTVGSTPGGADQTITTNLGATNTVILGNLIRRAGGVLATAFPGLALGAGSVPITTSLLVNTDANNVV